MLRRCNLPSGTYIRILYSTIYFLCVLEGKGLGAESLSVICPTVELSLSYPYDVSEGDCVRPRKGRYVYN